MDSRERLEKQRLKAEKQRQEDIALTKVLYWIVGAVVLEFLLLMTQKYYIDFTVDDFGISLAVGIASALKIITFAGIIAGAAVLFLAVSQWKKGKKGIFLWAIGAFLVMLGVYSAIVWQFNATGVDFLIFANVVFAVLAFVYYIYQTEFFAVAAACAAGVLGIYIRFALGTGMRTYVIMALLVVFLAAVAALAAAAQRRPGCADCEGEERPALAQDCQLYPHLRQLCADGAGPDCFPDYRYQRGRDGLLCGAYGVGADHGCLLHCEAHVRKARQQCAAGLLNSFAAKRISVDKEHPVGWRKKPRQHGCCRGFSVCLFVRINRSQVFGAVGGKELVKAPAGAVMELVEIGMGIGENQVIFGGRTAENLQRHVGTVVGHTLQIDKQLQELSTLLNGAGAGLEAFDVTALQLIPQKVHHLLQRLHLKGKLSGATGVAFQRLVKRLTHRIGEGSELALGCGRERDAALPEDGGTLGDIDGVIAHSFKIGEGVEQLGDLGALCG